MRLSGCDEGSKLSLDRIGQVKEYCWGDRWYDRLWFDWYGVVSSKKRGAG